MTKLTKKRRVALWSLLLAVPIGLFLAGRSAMPQQDGLPGPQLGAPSPMPGMGRPGPGPQESRDPELQKIREQQALHWNDERQKELVKDTDKLLALATELKSDVSKTDKDTLSIDVVKKAEEIEKLAKSVKDKMKAD